MVRNGDVVEAHQVYNVPSLLAFVRILLNRLSTVERPIFQLAKDRRSSRRSRIRSKTTLPRQRIRLCLRRRHSRWSTSLKTSLQRIWYDVINFDLISSTLINVIHKIPENPYQAALRFLQTNDLPESYIDEVVKFIERNTAGVQLGGGANEYVDPYTGASRYTSNSSSVPTTALQPSSAYMDPFTGASRYSGAASSSASAPAAPAPVTLRTLPVVS
jgi:hypothetical protein